MLFNPCFTTGIEPCIMDGGEVGDFLTGIGLWIMIKVSKGFVKWNEKEEKEKGDEPDVFHDLLGREVKLFSIVLNIFYLTNYIIYIFLFKY